MRIAIACLALWLGCGPETPELAPPSAYPAAIPLSGRRPRAMRNCPATVAGSQTVLARTPNGERLTITAADAGARREILARTRIRIERGAARPGVPPHSGLGGGPELIGFCPMLLLKTTVTYREVPGGVQIEIGALNPLDAGEVQARIEGRAAALGIRVPTTAMTRAPLGTAIGS